MRPKHPPAQPRRRPPPECASAAPPAAAAWRRRPRAPWRVRRARWRRPTAAPTAGAPAAPPPQPPRARPRRPPPPPAPPRAPPPPPRHQTAHPARRPRRRRACGPQSPRASRRWRGAPAGVMRGCARRGCVGGPAQGQGRRSMLAVNRGRQRRVRRWVRCQGPAREPWRCHSRGSTAPAAHTTTKQAAGAAAQRTRKSCTLSKPRRRASLISWPVAVRPACVGGGGREKTENLVRECTGRLGEQRRAAEQPQGHRPPPAHKRKRARQARRSPQPPPAQPLTALRQGPQLQQSLQPSPQEPRQRGHTHLPLASACRISSPCRFFRHSLLQGGAGQGGCSGLVRSRWTPGTAVPVLEAQLAAGAGGEGRRVGRGGELGGGALHRPGRAGDGAGGCSVTARLPARTHHPSLGTLPTPHPRRTRRTPPGGGRRRSRGACTSRAPPASSGGTCKTARRQAKGRTMEANQCW